MSLDNLCSISDVGEFAIALDRRKKFEMDVKVYCPVCARDNRFSISPEFVSMNERFTESYPLTRAPIWTSIAQNLKDFVGSQFSFSCATCNSKARSLVHPVGGKIENLVFFETRGSVATNNTPEAVKHYLEQAHLSFSVKCHSAAQAMYRTALDALLYHEGYQTGMVGNKIAALEADMAKGTAKEWTRGLLVPYMKIIKDLGNSTLHIGADINKEKSITDGDILAIEEVFKILVDEVFEKPHIANEKLSKLQAIKDKKK